MIVRKEIISDEDYNELEPKIQTNIEELLLRVNKLRSAYGRPIGVSSGFRSIEKHLAVYAKKGITDKTKIPMKSKHLSGQAVDFADASRSLQAWILANEEYLEKLGLWFEDFDHTPTWVHAQIVPPKSGKRFFIP